MKDGWAQQTLKHNWYSVVTFLQNMKTQGFLGVDTGRGQNQNISPSQADRSEGQQQNTK